MLYKQQKKRGSPGNKIKRKAIIKIRILIDPTLFSYKHYILDKRRNQVLQDYEGQGLQADVFYKKMRISFSLTESSLTEYQDRQKLARSETKKKSNKYEGIVYTASW